jgi:membrane protein implicated in regulation of membrane protease activity
MGVLLILLGVVLAGALVDFLIENDVATAAGQPMAIAGTSLTVSTPILALIAFALGALAVLLIVAGIRTFSRAHRRTLRDRMARLEDENARLVTQQNLQNVMPGSAPVDRSPEPVAAVPRAEPAHVKEIETLPAVAAQVEPEPEEPMEPQPDEPAEPAQEIVRIPDAAPETPEPVSVTSSEAPQLPAQPAPDEPTHRW